MMPAALCLLTTSFRSGSDGPRALGVWGGVAGLASAVGVFLGGVLTDGPGSRWVLEVNPPIAVLSLFGIFALIPADASSDRTNGFDVAGAFLITGSMLTLVYTLVKAPDQGWSDARTIIVLTAGAVLLIAFVVVELASRNPLVPLSIFRTPGLATADITQLVGVGGFVTMFFFLTLYMQYVLGFSPLRTGSAYLGLALGVGVSAGIVTGLIGQIGTRPVIVAGALVTSVGPYLLSRIPADGNYVADLLPGILVVAFGVAGVFVGTTTAANAAIPRRWPAWRRRSSTPRSRSAARWRWPSSALSGNLGAVQLLETAFSWGSFWCANSQSPSELMPSPRLLMLNRWLVATIQSISQISRSEKCRWSVSNVSGLMCLCSVSSVAKSSAARSLSSNRGLVR
jgi:hypothetical protein